MNFTKSQQNAIDISKRDLLITASAGSGKTATLTERVLRSVCREKDPVDIRRLLIVTFTKKAAEELRQRIRKKLEQVLKDDPGNEMIKRQLSLLPSADISTIHSFYSKVISAGFERLGLPPKTRIADSAEAAMLAHRIMNETIEGYYNNSVSDEYDIEDAEDFFDTFEKIRPGDDLCSIFEELYTAAQSYPEFLDFYKNCEIKCSEAALDFDSSDYHAQIKKEVKYILDGFISRYDGLFEKYASDETFQTQLYGAAYERYEYLKITAKYLREKTYTEIREYLYAKTSFSSAKTVHGDPECKTESVNLRDAFKKALDKIKAYYGYELPDAADICRATASLCNDLYKLLCRFDKAFAKEKISEKIIDYSDMERFSYKLLCEGDGSIADGIRKKYDEIYIDEFQDVNRIQDCIFSAISDNNRFMVGDVKQSIYAFRGSDPSIFAEYRKKFKPYSDDSGDPCIIFLSENFRCDDNVIKFTNRVFEKIFGLDENMPYADEDRLVFAKKTDHPSDSAVKLVSVIGGKKPEEAKYVAKEIKKLLKTAVNDDGTRLRASDIAVLCRNEKTCKTVEKELSQSGIGCVNYSNKSFFDSAEVLLAVNMLTAIDNPMRDVPLAAMMKSPVYNFTLNDLALIRLHRKKVPLFIALQSYAEETGDEKCLGFLKKLSYLRYKSRAMQTDKFIRLFYKETSLLTVIYNKADKSEPEDRKNNLMKLYDFARNYESGAFKGLYGFISFCNEMISEGRSFENVKTHQADRVTVQTMHGSKGLEYPVCFIVGANSKFNDEFNKKSIITHVQAGIGIRTKDKNGLIRRGPLYNLVCAKKRETLVKDEARLLYVALTRARKYLYIVSSSSKEFSTPDTVTYDTVIKCNSFADMLYLSDYDEEYCEKITVAAEELTDESEYMTFSDAVSDAEYDWDTYKELKEIYDYEYPYKALQALPKKAAVSMLYPSFLDERDDVSVKEKDEIPLILPDYAENTKAPDAAERGTATHLFMQFCNFENAEKDVFEEAKRLALTGYIKQDSLDLISYEEVRAFFSSPLYRRMKEAKSSGRIFKREYRFNIELDAKDFTSDEKLSEALDGEVLLVQGVIDCFFEEADGTLTVCDYKTDRIHSIPEFIERHRQQLSYYKTAIERITMKRVSKTELYSFHLGRSVTV